MSNCNTIMSVLSANGSDQKQRYISALQPENISLNAFETTDWILFAHNFSKYVNYFETSGPLVPSGNWESFFDFFKLNGENPSVQDQVKLDKIKKSIVDLIGENKKENAVTPHLTLFITFLMLLENSKIRYNKLTKRHLDFYYGQILKIEKLPATPDSVYMVFELAKNAAREKIEAKTAFDGGKDPSGKARLYYSNDEFIAGKTVVSSLKNVYNDITAQKIVAAPFADSCDGLGKAFPAGNTRWWPFGYAGDPGNPKELPDAAIGFAVASPMLALSEGKRSVQFTFTFKENLPVMNSGAINQAATLFLSTAKKWLEIKPSVSDITIKSAGLYTTKTEGKTLKIAFQLDENSDAIVNYNAKTLGKDFESAFPVIKFHLDASGANGYALYQCLAQNKLEGITIDLDVQNIKNVMLENDNGPLNPAKPFYPFGVMPVEGSGFYLRHEEAFSKNWNNIQVDLSWKNAPEDFVEHYKAYKNDAKKTISATDFKNALITTDAAGTQIYKEEGKIVDTSDYFKYDVQVLDQNVWNSQTTDGILFGAGRPAQSEIIVSNTDYGLDTRKNGQVRIVLKKSFLHELYPKIYALALTLSADNPAMVLPNQPYTPFAEQLNFHYSASESCVFSDATKTNFTDGAIALFHLHPFGYSQEHLYLKSQLGFLAAPEKENLFLAPSYCKGGSLFIGLENAEALEQVTLLFEMSEGSEDPTTPSFTGKQKVEWSVLCQNVWKKLGSSDIILNETNNLLQSGRLVFNLPEEATQENTLLPGNKFWLKARIHKKYNAVCKVIGIHSQVVAATFENNGNDLSHLSSGIAAGTISKLSQRISAVKSVAQPYNSFGYKSGESDKEYYTRVSERLRHKNRAVTMWDYEHILLQKFPELYKVKCLNHTCDCSFQSPGNLTLVLIPDMLNKNVFDIYQPRVSTATLSKVREHISGLNSMHADTFVINPNYEEVSVSLKAKFREGLDVNFYSGELNSDITRFLSPWTQDKSDPIEFGLEIHISILIHYIEELNYVDYLEDVKLFKDGVAYEKTVSPSNPKSILVSAKKHTISTEVKSCKSPINEPEEQCQF